MNTRFSEDDPSQYRRFRRPPNYFSRRVQLRLLMLVSLLMLVIVAMDEARDPKYYAWMWEGQPAVEVDDETVDTQLPPQAAPVPLDPGVIRSEVGRSEPIDSQVVEAASRGASEPLDRAKIDAWAALLDAISPRQETQLRNALYASRHRRQLSSDAKRRLAPVLDMLIEQWKRYLAEARGSLDDESNQLSDEQKEGWRAVLDELDSHWKQQWRPAFEAFFQDRDLLDEERQTLAGVQTILDRLALAAIEDNTVLRVQDQGAWFRLLERLASRSSESLADEAGSHVAFLQLYRQPDSYRGKLVTTRGVARLGYRVDAPRNVLGIDEYNILWVRLRGGPNSPLVVYALNTAAGFPKLKSKDADRETTKLDHDILVTGYFFKNWAYRSKGGINVAPLMLAKEVSLVESESTLGDVSKAAPTKRILMVVVSMAVLAILLAGGVYLVHAWPSRAFSFHTHTAQEEIETPDKSQVRDDVLTVLGRLEHPPEDP